METWEKNTVKKKTEQVQLRSNDGRLEENLLGEAVQTHGSWVPYSTQTSGRVLGLTQHPILPKGQTGGGRTKSGGLTLA